MAPSEGIRLQRMGACLVDLAEHGIDLATAARRPLRRLVRLHLEYFQLMLGYDARPTEIVELVTRARQASVPQLTTRRACIPVQRPAGGGCSNR